MKSGALKHLILAVAGMVFLAIAGCNTLSGGVRVGELQTESQSVELGDSDRVNVDVNMGSGELNVSGGASNLMEAEFTYNVSELKPEVTFQGSTLVVEHPDTKFGLDTLLDLSDFRNEWDLRFNDDVAMEMRINLGAGQSILDLGSLNLERLDVDTGAGDLDLDLSGGVALTSLDANMGAGESTIDLTGDWQNDLNVDINSGVGQLTMRLPSNAGVIVNVDGGLGNVQTSGLNRDGDNYVNDAYGESEVTVRVNIDAGVGQINLETGE